ncbi:MAG: rhodanese-like domain-containing protein [Planctomycetes bacterium]|nr:rhodanese-like domain-containing protein [Planctomycetota bacterium]
MKTLILAILCCFAPAILAADVKVPDISKEELTKAIADKKVTVIDVNGTESYKEGHIPTAIDFETTKADLATKLPKDKSSLIVAYCGSPKCPAYKQAAEAAIALGYTNVKHFSAGISGWKESGAAVEKAGTEAAPAPAKAK